MPKAKKSAFSDLLNAAGNSGEDIENSPASQEITPVSSKNTEGKRSNSDYRQTSIYVKKDLHRKLIRHLEDSGYNGDFSDWIENCMENTIAQSTKK
jgi:hypothetical protein